MSISKFTAEVTVTNADEALDTAHKVAAQIKAVADVVEGTTIHSVTVTCKSDAASRAHCQARVDKIRDDIRAPIIDAITALAAACRAHGWWKDANDLLLDAAEQAFDDKARRAA